MNRQEDSIKSKAAQVADECIAVRLRMLTRAVTKLYSNVLRPYGLTVSQMNILVAVAGMGPVNQQGICQALCLDKSTLREPSLFICKQFADGRHERSPFLGREVRAGPWEPTDRFPSGSLLASR
jgi:hypothetical protein